MHIVLYHPEIPQNTGNIARTCAATGAKLHLIRPLGFELSDKYLKRAGLDYWHMMTYEVHASWEAFRAASPDARSLNLSNSVAIVLYEALRQLGFPGLSGQGHLHHAQPEGGEWKDYV